MRAAVLTAILTLTACAPKAKPFDAMDFEPEAPATPHGGFLVPAGTVQAEILLAPAFQKIWLLDTHLNEIATDPEKCRGLVVRRGEEEFWFAPDDSGSGFRATELGDAHEMGLKGSLGFRDCPVEGAVDTAIRIDQAREKYARHGGRVYANADYLIEVVREGPIVKFYLSTPEQPFIDARKATVILLYDLHGRSFPTARAPEGEYFYARVPARPGRGRLMFHLFNEELDLEVEW